MFSAKAKSRSHVDTARIHAGDNVAMNRIEKGRGVRACRNPLSCDVMIKDVHLNRKERRH